MGHTVGGEECLEGAAERSLGHEVEVWQRVDADPVQPNHPLMVSTREE